MSDPMQDSLYNMELFLNERVRRGIKLECDEHPVFSEGGFHAIEIEFEPVLNKPFRAKFIGSLGHVIQHVRDFTETWAHERDRNWSLIWLHHEGNPITYYEFAQADGGSNKMTFFDECHLKFLGKGRHITITHRGNKYECIVTGVNENNSKYGEMKPDWYIECQDRAYDPDWQKAGVRGHRYWKQGIDGGELSLGWHDDPESDPNYDPEYDLGGQ